MSELLGWVQLTGAARHTESNDPRRALAAMQARYGAPTVVAQTPEYGLAANGDRSASRRACAIYQGPEAIAIVCGKPRLLEVSGAADHIAQQLASAYRQHGAGVLRHLRGSFALSILLLPERRLLLATDRLAVCPIAYAQTDSALVFATRADVVRAHPAVGGALDLQALYDYLYFHFVPSPRTAYQRVARLLPGHYIELNDGRLTTACYWQLAYSNETGRVPMAALKAEFRELLAGAVREAAADGGQVGTFLSGGTDSSTVTGLLAQQSARRVPSYSIGFDATGFDETAYARLAAKHFNTEHHEYYLSAADIVDATPRIAAHYDMPFGNSSAVPSYYCARLAQRDGISRLLAGDGGDELFGGNARYAKQHVFSLYERLPLSVRRYLIEPLTRGPNVPPFSKLRSYVAQASIPLPARLETYNLLERLGISAVLEPDFVAAIDPGEPLALLNAQYGAARANTTLNRLLAIDWKFTLADNDLVKVSGMGSLAGIDVAYPMLNEELVAFAARLPIDLKLRRTRLRYFFKEALKDFLPAEIIAKKKHGFGLPFGPWLLTHRPLYDLAYDSLSALAGRGIVRPAFIRAVFEKHLQQSPAYYGTMIWLLLILELWLREQRDITARENVGAQIA